MATVRPVISIYQCKDPTQKVGTVPMPHVLMAPLRPDLVRFIYENVRKNKRQAYAVSPKAGYQTAAESWGTGRAVARIPRAPGGGTHRAGQGAFGNMCRGGGMFAPTKTWRRWHRRVPVKQKRHAITSALAASALPPLVMARGHRIDDIAELPLVVDNNLESYKKTRSAMSTMRKLGVGADLDKVVKTKKLKSGKGKGRTRHRYVVRRGPMIIYNEDHGITKAFRNIPGVDVENVTRLNLLKLAPGGHFGRLIVWTQGAFEKIQKMYGTWKSGAPAKKNYTILRAAMENADVNRIINSTEVQSVLRPKKEAEPSPGKKTNPFRNKETMQKLNPAYEETLAARKRRYQEGTAEFKAAQESKKQRLAEKREYNKKHKRGPDTFYKKIMRAFEAKPQAEEEAAEEE